MYNKTNIQQYTGKPVRIFYKFKNYPNDVVGKIDDFDESGIALINLSGYLQIINYRQITNITQP